MPWDFLFGGHALMMFDFISSGLVQAWMLEFRWEWAWVWGLEWGLEME